MAFPPVPDHVWDVTTPLDTQLANLLGQDIRNLKDDVMQRLSLLSGTIANIPAPETVNATWGGAGFGLLYFATDTGQIFQWSGVFWTDVSALFVRNQLLTAQANLGPVIGNNTDQPIFNFNLLANTVALLKGIRVTVTAHKSIGAALGTYKYSLNGVQFVPNFGLAGDLYDILTILNTGVGTGVFSKTSFNGTNISYNGTIAGLNWVGNQLLNLTYNVPNTDTIVPMLYTVELLR